MSGADRLDWVLSDTEHQPLAARYDEWASTYDKDHDEWGWRGPAAAVDSLARCVLQRDQERPLAVLDAGCGTGRVGAALAAKGLAANLLGVDLSAGMLAVAATTPHYETLILGSLETLPLRSGAVDAVVATGVFTHGHVGPNALRELVRVTRVGGVITLTLRTDVVAHYSPTIDALVTAGHWIEVDRTEPQLLHPDHTDVEQTVVSWQCTS